MPSAHEAGHVVGAVRLGFRFDRMVMDPHGDFGWHGTVEGLRRPPAPLVEDAERLRTAEDVRARLAAFDAQAYQDAIDHAVVARLGAMCTIEEPWTGPGARADREIVEVWRPRDWDPGVWSFVVEDAAARLRRSESFRLDHHAVANALADAGELTFDEVAALITITP